MLNSICGCFSSKIDIIKSEKEKDKDKDKDNEIYILKQQLEDKTKELEQIENELYSTNISTRATISKLRKQVSTLSVTS
jgi:predicted RNase H-like nuclease (RuvC/YqgF family)